MNYNPSPRSEVLESEKRIAEHRALVQNPQLRQQLGVALSEMQRRIAAGCPPTDRDACAAGHLRMLGAQDLLEVFYNLAESPPAPKNNDTLNLPANVQKIPGPRR